ncbi:MAG: hypothetical protein A4E32_01273 [Methanomassiliicoccales archaeon PtaU1.Bin124]|nr:MAG: hypothetical protein A4E32_01273 [Methanomassiliicoccales archaeon PtaU1.Bin124]
MGERRKLLGKGRSLSGPHVLVPLSVIASAYKRRVAVPMFGPDDIETSIHQNPLYKRGFYTMALLTSVFVLFGILQILTGHVFGFLVIFLSALIPLATIYSEYFHRPTWVRIRRDGFDLAFRTGVKKSYRWDQVKYLLWNPLDPNKKSFKRKGNCAIQVKGGTPPFPIIDEIGIKFHDAYMAATGQAPPDKTRGRY